VDSSLRLLPPVLRCPPNRGKSRTLPRAWLWGTRVRLELDVQTRDRYGRLLAYLWLPDATMVNERILEAGRALLLTAPPNVRYVERFRDVQRRARERGAGLWAADAPSQERRTACESTPVVAALGVSGAAAPAHCPSASHHGGEGGGSSVMTTKGRSPKSSNLGTPSVGR
jgi:hypothetical protein